MSLRLAITQGPQEGRTLEFAPGSTVPIGRLVRGNAIAIKDSGVSSKHLSIESGPHGNWLLRDLESSNGTLLNGAAVDPGAAVELRDGDCIKIGETTSISVAIGETTSISVAVGEAESLGPRRNPRRGRPPRGEAVAEKKPPARQVSTRQRGRRLRSDGAEATGSVLEKIPEDSEVEAGEPMRTWRGENPQQEREFEGDVGVVGIDEEGCARVVEKSSDRGSKEVDLETMTLGEWLDFLEADLPRQIVEATEEIIKGMASKAQRVREYAAQQKKGKGVAV